MERKRRFQTRQQYAEEKAKDTLFDKLDKHLYMLIAVVAIAIIATLAILISRVRSKTDRQGRVIRKNRTSGERDEKANPQGAKILLKTRSQKQIHNQKTQMNLLKIQCFHLQDPRS